MDKSILLCMVDGSEETEAVTTFDLLVGHGGLTITGSRGGRLLADAPLSALADEPYYAIVLPGGDARRRMLPAQSVAGGVRAPHASRL